MLVDLIISYFIYDTYTLLACSLTCYSWYIAAVPHLHHSLTTDDDDDDDDWTGTKYSWPKPLRESYKLGLLPFVKRFRIRQLGIGFKFNPWSLSGRTLRYFSALTNLQDLGIDELNVSEFMPKIQQCFGHLSPTLRSLALKEPYGSCRQISCFIGLFPNLQDLKLHYAIGHAIGLDKEGSTDDSTLIPLSTPPLQGRLTLICFTKEDLVKTMINFFGRLRFRHMDLFGVSCTKLLLDTCAETLETLRLYPTDPHGEKFTNREEDKHLLTGPFVANSRSLPQRFDLSGNQSLRTLETTAQSITRSADTASNFFKTVLSSVTTPALLDVVVIYQDIYPRNSPGCTREPVCFRHRRPMGLEMDAHRFQPHLKVFREMHSVRDFRLVLCVDVFDCIVEDATRLLGDIVKAEEAKGGFDFLLSEPLVICEKRVVRTRLSDFNVGYSKANIPASAL